MTLMSHPLRRLASSLLTPPRPSTTGSWFLLTRTNALCSASFRMTSSTLAGGSAISIIFRGVVPAEDVEPRHSGYFESGYGHLGAHANVPGNRLDLNNAGKEPGNHFD